MATLVLNEEQQMLKDAARGFLQERAPIAEFRRLRDTRDATGFSRDVWAAMVEQGFAGTLIPEAHGGFAFGHVGMGQIMEESGRTLALSPLLSSAVLGVSALTLAGSEAQQADLLPAVGQGELLLALAVDESGRHDPECIRTRAEHNGSGYTLNGCKTFVLDGHVADRLIVAARTSGDARATDGVTLFLVNPDTAGVEVERTIMVDARNAAEVRFNDAEVPADAVLGRVDEGLPVLEQLLDIGNAHLAAELLGLTQEVFERTVQYLKERKQFGVAIGSFQALQHRAADLFSEIELLKSAVVAALSALDEGDDHADQLCSLAKARASKVAELATNEGVQMHGGMGMTDEFDVGLFLKRARAAQQTFGDQRYHARRFARLRGY
ncbi:acyl-CoA dehydrogenase [Aquisalimonas sp.]|uniref:acyl-CoA dehydrogenase family protein n=1 Tax=unclassified Aquisalimonas TaxID=2644645 RepID=UPI0025C6E422|nr:acyl-CoA dehydrogenase [Aquisalimonas sp.]